MIMPAAMFGVLMHIKYILHARSYLAYGNFILFVYSFFLWLGLFLALK